MPAYSKMEDGIVWLVVDGDFLASEMIAESNKWLPSHENEVAGLITDVRKMKNSSPVEQKKVEEQRKENKSTRPMAVLGKDNAMSALVKIYMRFTKAENVRYFTDENEAKDWVKTFKPKQ